VAALARNEKAPARHALGEERDPLSLLIRVLLVGDAGGVDDVAQALPVDDLGALLMRRGDEVTCPYELSPHAQEGADWWVLSDRTDASGHPTRSDHVLGVGGASTTLAQLTVRRHVQRALDIGTGCGVQALHLAQHADRVTATDSVSRALRLAATGFALSGVDVELLEGDLAEPVADREFDLVVCNPPFVVGPSSRFAYRDSGRAADAMSRDAVRAAAGLLAEDGVAQLLVNWLHVAGEDWRDRVADWVSDLGCDAWLIERDEQEPVDYVSTWLADAGEREPAFAQEWLRWFDDQRGQSVGFGWVLLRRGDPPHRVAMETLVHPVDQPLGPHFAGWLDRVDWLRGVDDTALLDARLQVAPAARLDVAHAPPDWAPLGQALLLDEGFRWQLPCDQATAAIVRGCDGQTPLRSLVAVLAAAIGVPEGELAAPAAATVRGLVDRGLLLPPS